MLVMPLRDEAISQRQYEIQSSERKHEDLLRILFEATLSTLAINHVKHPETYNLASFLDDNKISRGQSFNPKSLPSTDHLSTYLDAPPIDSQDIDFKDERAHDGPVSEENDSSKEGKRVVADPRGASAKSDEGTAQSLQDKPSSKLRDGHSALDAATEGSSDAGNRSLKFGKASDAVDPESDSRVQSRLSQERIVEPSTPIPTVSDNANLSQPAGTKELLHEQRPDIIPDVEPHPEITQEDHLEHPGQETDNEQEQGGPLSATSRLPTHGLTPPTSEEEEEAERRSNNGIEQRTKDYPQPSEASKPQTDIARVETLGEVDSTPDEQLRLEEAQSIQLSNVISDADPAAPQSMPPPSSLTSGFVHDTMTDGDAVLGVSEEIASVKEDTNQDGSGQNNDLSRPATGMKGSMLPGWSGDSSRDLTLSRRPPMRIDTGVHSTSNSPSAGAGKSDAVSIPTPLEPAVPRKTIPATASAQSPPERMTTRVSSGALRHKSVSEILGETPRATLSQTEKSPFGVDSGDLRREDEHALQTPKSASSFPSPDPATFKQRLNELKEKEKSKLSTVVFASSRNPEALQAQHSEEDIPAKENRDYLLTLFNFQAASPPKAHPLNHLVKSAHKTLTTADHLTDFSERQACCVLNKIYDMQTKNKWSLRQHERSIEPRRPATHWDVLLGEVRWMRTDFKEERKWKTAAAKFTADACAVWVAGTPEERRSLQVKVRREPVKERPSPDAAPTPDLIHSTGDETSEATDEEYTSDLGNAPAAIFTLPPEMFVHALNRSPMAENLLHELPLYQPNVGIKNAALQFTDLDSDATWKKKLVPISKYSEGKIVSISKSKPGPRISLEDGPPRKRSRFTYAQDDEHLSSSKLAADIDTERALEPEQSDVALFDPEHKHIRDRIHTGHAFRPPSEYIMPSQSFFESRSSSQWTQAEDDELRRTVKAYSYNWSLISSCMSFPSTFSSGAERRTPWECFERWISLEGLPVEMAKINYFRAYHARLQAAQKTVENNQLAQQQQQGGNAAQLPLRRRTTQPYSVERRKDQRYLHIIDAMRKLAKKRETAASKQAQVVHAAALRKAQEAPRPRNETHTPQEFSRLKHNQQMALEEKHRQYRAQMMQAQKAHQAARANQHNGQQATGVPPARNPISAGPNGGSPHMTTANQHAPGRGQGGDPSRPMPQMPRILNGQTSGVLPPASQNVPHAPMQPNAQVQMQMQRMPPGIRPDNRILQEASQIQAQQQAHQAFQQQVRQQGQPQPHGHAGSPNMQNPNSLAQNPASLLAPLPGRSSPSISGVPPPQGSSTSPHMRQPQSLSNGMTPAINHINSQVKARNPQASPEQITRMTTDELARMSEARLTAMQAAAGNANMNAVVNNSNIGLQGPPPLQQTMMANGGSPRLNQAHYASIMRSQQANQQRSANLGGGQGMNGNNVNGNGMSGNGINGPARNGSRSVTPMIQRTSSAQGGPRPSQSPSARPVGLAQ
ncbi:RNA polymerase II transcription elongation factor SpEAF [Lecanora helva]